MSVYLHLFHGRSSPKAELEDWGSDGPTLGPLDYIHTTYSSMVHLGVGELGNIDLNITEDLIYYGGTWYGDWSVFDGDVLALDRERDVDHDVQAPNAWLADNPERRKLKDRRKG